MTLVLTPELLRRIHADGEKAYPEEGAGLLLGALQGEQKVIQATLPISNSREDKARHNRYLLTPEDYLQGELQAARLGLDVLGVFHSHPDHPNLPSEFDREWAMPFFSYIITSVHHGQAEKSRSWLLREDRSAFDEETLLIQPDEQRGNYA
jgi:proteasome lid subunit RPN8/RPN11